MKNLKFLKNISLGACLGSIVGICFCWILDSSLSDALQRYGTFLLSAVVTLFGSGIALFSALMTFNRQEEIRREDNEKELMASRAFLAPALAEVHQRAERNARITLATARRKTLGNKTPSDSLSEYEGQPMKPFPDGQIFDILFDNVKIADPTSRNWLAAIANHYQVALARTDDLEFSPLNEDLQAGSLGSYDLVLDWVTVSNLTSHCFNYARGRTDTVDRFISTANWLSPLRQAFGPLVVSTIIPEYDSLEARQRQNFRHVFKLDEETNPLDLEPLSFTELAEKNLISSSYPIPSK